MDRRLIASSVFAAVIGAAGAATLAPSVATAQQMMSKDQMMQVQKANKDRAMLQHLVACYGINAAGKNDCAVGVHSCAGQATSARDPASFVLLPAGDCEKIAGGTLKPA